MIPKQKPRRSKQDYATPDDFIEAARRRLGLGAGLGAFAFDFAADETNAKALTWWGEQDDSLSKTPEEWRAQITPPDWGWLNPEFSDIKPWARRCSQVRLLGGQVALLVPAAVGSNWFRDYVHGQALVLMLNGRIHFMPDRPKWGYPKDCVLCLFSPNVAPGYEVWTWKTPQQRRKKAA